MRHLGGAVQFKHVARRVVAGDGAARFQRHAGMPADRRASAATTAWAVAKRRVDVAIALADDRRLGRTARLELARLVRGAQNRRQFLDVERDQLGGILRQIGVVGEDRRDRFADITHPFGRKQPLAVGLEALDRGSGENRSAECRQHRRPSTPHARRSVASAALASIDAQPCRARSSSARRAYAVAAETRYRRQTGRARSAAAGPRAAAPSGR